MPPKKPEAPQQDLFVEVVFLLAGLYLLSVIFARIQYLLASTRYGSVESVWGRMVHFFLLHFWPGVKFLALCVVAAAIVGIVYSLKKMTAIAEEEKQVYGLKEDSKEPTEIQAEKNLKWERVVNHINSPNSSDWKLAIIEADIMLDDLLHTLGYHGDSIGDMLKAVEKSDFLSLDQAWEAHKIRNRIAHEGAGFDLTERDAKQTIANFEAVFKEFKII